MKNPFRGNTKGFSVIEIMITMTIIAILGGIATVAILKERSSFHQAACMSNLRQISQGMQIYYNENGKFPQDGYPDDGNDPLPLSRELAHYVPGKKVFLCPEDDNPVSIANFASYDPYYVARKDPYDVDKLVIGCPNHREAKKATNLLGAGATNITNIDTVLVNGQEIPADGTSAERAMSNVNDEMTFSDGSKVKITGSQAGYGTYLVQSVRLADGTLYSIIRVADEGTIDVQVTSGSKFEVVTPSAIIGVRGTRFTVGTVNANSATTVTVITGIVDVVDRKAGAKVVLSIGGTTTVTIDDLDDNTDYDGDGYTGNQGDCDDGDPNVHPGAGEILDNGKNDDCNSATPDSSLDVDNDGDGFTENQGDCNDTDSSIHPGAEDIPGNSIDEDCDGQDTPINSNDIDDDGDGFTENQGDCDDGNAGINPGATEVFDSVDNDCDGQIDEGFTDADGDGYALELDDCDDTNPAVNPGAAEVPYNGADDDCNPATPDDDIDGDGFVSAADCNDNDPNVNSGMAEIPDNGIDDDCNGATPDSTLDIDNDGDGFTENQGDCDDGNVGINPGMAEIPGNGIDDDCNPATADISLGDQALIDFINQQPPLASADLRDSLINESPLTEAVLMAIMNRNPLMDTMDNNQVFQANDPLSDNVLNVMINTDSLLMPAGYRAVLLDNTPLSENILNQVINKNTLLNSAGYKTVLIDNSPLPQSILDQVIAGTPSGIVAADRQAVLDAQ